MSALETLNDTIAPVDAQVTRPHSTAPAAAEAPTEVLITTQQVVFSTAAARGVHPDRTGSRFGAMVRRFFATDTHESLPRQRYQARRYGFLENSVMSRAMDRL
jgi:hypothetical protein